MPAKRIPGTNKIIFTNPHTGDLVINMEDHPDIDDSIAKEDIKKIGDWEDYTGSESIPGNEVIYQGIQDGDLGAVKNEVTQRDVDFSNRGKRKSTHRQRYKLVHMEV